MLLDHSRLEKINNLTLHENTKMHPVASRTSHLVKRLFPARPSSCLFFPVGTARAVPRLVRAQTRHTHTEVEQDDSSSAEEDGHACLHGSTERQQLMYHDGMDVTIPQLYVFELGDGETHPHQQHNANAAGGLSRTDPVDPTPRRDSST